MFTHHMKPAVTVVVTMALAATALLATGACGPLTEPEWEWRIEPGLIEAGAGLEPPIELPDTIVGTGPRIVVVRTRGSSSCIRAAGADVAYGTRAVSISPMDSMAVRGICTDDLAAHPRDVVIDFSSAGTWTVRVIGRSFDDDVVFETHVVVEDATS
jgi:hypothetical protein